MFTQIPSIFRLQLSIGKSIIILWFFIVETFFFQSVVALPTDCFKGQEQRAEQIVRAGLRLREGAIACHAAPFFRDSYAQWQRLDEKFGQKFLEQKLIREKAFIRQFGEDPDNQLETWDARIVYHYRHHPLSTIYCDRIEYDLNLFLNKGWSLFLKQAQTGKDEVEMDFNICPNPR
jgi:hypothetical protein